MANAGKYSSPMEHLGITVSEKIRNSSEIVETNPRFHRMG